MDSTIWPYFNGKNQSPTIHTASNLCSFRFHIMIHLCLEACWSVGISFSLSLLSFHLYWFPIPAIPHLFLTIIKIQTVKLTKLPGVRYSRVISLFLTHQYYFFQFIKCMDSLFCLGLSAQFYRQAQIHTACILVGCKPVLKQELQSWD